MSNERSLAESFGLAISALRPLPEDTFGRDTREGYPYRDELIHNLERARSEAWNAEALLARAWSVLSGVLREPSNQLTDADRKAALDVIDRMQKLRLPLRGEPESFILSDRERQILYNKLWTWQTPDLEAYSDTIQDLLEVLTDEQLVDFVTSRAGWGRRTDRFPSSFGLRDFWFFTQALHVVDAWTGWGFRWVRRFVHFFVVMLK